MRLRTTLASALGALALVVTVPTPSNAATGNFLYTYRNAAGDPVPGGLANPKSLECINIPGATEEIPAYAPKNLTLSVATVFVDADCDGDVFYVMNPGKILGDRLKLRSVVFS
ncbi:hypothetical protein [Streptomyces sp. NRRL B-1347]|uniref:hypothetical protein n=1 Tax=Streptomyces sp. NRRL B-1347 TaxID=1476877 RepID=UPI0004C7E5CC|nr:hypothetical protein [Streptomyces sp. NRRL B-1347]